MAKSLSDIQSHVNPIRIRARGNGDLQVFLLDSGNGSVTLQPQALSVTTAKSLNYLSNFRAELICLKIMTTEKDEYFIVSNMWAYIKPTAASFPQS